MQDFLHNFRSTRRVAPGLDCARGSHRSGRAGFPHLLGSWVRSSGPGQSARRPKEGSSSRRAKGNTLLVGGDGSSAQIPTVRRLTRTEAVAAGVGDCSWGRSAGFGGDGGGEEDRKKSRMPRAAAVSAAAPPIRRPRRDAGARGGIAASAAADRNVVESKAPSATAAGAKPWAVGPTEGGAWPAGSMRRGGEDTARGRS